MNKKWRVCKEITLKLGDCLLWPQVWSDERRIAFCEMQNAGIEEVESNARLIAAAPDMERRLSKILEIIEVEYLSDHWTEEIYKLAKGSSDND